jgi:hypothetical protein
MSRIAERPPQSGGLSASVSGLLRFAAMRCFLVGAVVLSVLGCNGRTMPLRYDAAEGACDCRVEAGDGGGLILTMSWSCYCASNYADGCTRTLADECSTGTRDRMDYPGCGLTVLQIRGAFGPYQDVYDQDGKLVGAMASSDTSAYVCPNDPTMSALTVRAGQFPSASCAPVWNSCLDAGN